MTAERPEQPGRVPVGELRELVKHFREQHELTADGERGPIHGTPYGNGVSAGLDYAANELEAVLEKYE